MATRPLIGLSRKVLIERIASGDPACIREGQFRNASRIEKGKDPLAGYGAPAPAPAPAPAAGVDIDAIVRAAVAAALAGSAPAPAPAPAPAVANPDVSTWAATLEDCDGSRWEAYTHLADAGWKYRRIAEAAGVTPGSVGNAVSKHRRGIRPDLSFCGK